MTERRSPLGTQPSGYEVSVAGDLGPALRAALADLRPTCRPPSTLFRLRVPAGRSVADVTEMLRSQGLELLALRVVPDRNG
jgi:hypothetical protein